MVLRSILSCFHAVAGDEELRIPLRKATPLSGSVAALAQLLSTPAVPTAEHAASPAEELNRSTSMTVHDENTAPTNGSIASHNLKL
jgi:hypothetical protein